ncbi:putative O-methyltransferase YrrM [Pedobacter africanus]|uniref:O-methyltransferase YrrM n=1 Tax=Pedobacter africanus TaxID=151894 RepID=A0ACC6L2W6_9SPHI|nr:FkbM family methyltransferase [Pedobacter africanus]MDR6785777.1 putative O-methyltransferase YrrM [Pedobacter africanus]
MSNLKALATLITKPKRLKALLSFNHKGYLENIGWFNAFEQHAAVDKDGQPIPWVTYSFIDFIKTRLNKTQTIFEYGSGSSTLFYAKHVSRVVSVEHDESWYHKIVDSKAQNAEMIFTKLERGGEYSKKASLLDEKFDIIIVDGRDRVNCCKNSISALTPAGVVVLDDSERKEYEEARQFFKAHQFKELSFSGISPGLFYPKATSVFYRSENCLGI